MTTKMRPWAAAAGLLAAMLLPAPAGAATAPATGTIVTTGRTVLASHQAGPNTFELRHVTRRMSGTFEGDVDSLVAIVTHADGSAVFQGFETCACTVAGRTGTVTFRFHGQIENGVPSAHLVAVFATGGLAGLHAELDLTGVSYTGSYRF
jgi:hypothetical protein